MAVGKQQAARLQSSYTWPTPAGVIGPGESLTSGVNQIYPIINNVFEQMTGSKEIQAVDTASLVAMGTTLENRQMYDLFLNTLARRIGYTIDGYRVYRNKYSELVRNVLEWGAIVQKITADMPEAVADKMFDVGKMNGQSLDHYIINTPKVQQRFFDKETPYSFFITMQTQLLREAFLNEYSMASFINQIFGKVRNKIEFTNEELGRLCVANFVLNLQNYQHYHLVSIYNSKNAGATPVTTATALKDNSFMRFMVGFINNIGLKMENMSVLFNSEGWERFTPVANRKFYILSDVITALQTEVYYSAFNKGDVMANPTLLVPYWQASKPENGNYDDWSVISTIEGTIQVDGAVQQKTLNNLIGVMFDYEALGTFREEEMVLTTPINARGAYYNTFWHERQLYFNDMTENGVAFFLD